jgi:hypothetical protein
VATSTAEVEYVAIAHAAQQAIHLKQMLEEIGIKQEHVKIYPSREAHRKQHNANRTNQAYRHQVPCHSRLCEAKLGETGVVP